MTASVGGMLDTASSVLRPPTGGGSVSVWRRGARLTGRRMGYDPKPTSGIFEEPSRIGGSARALIGSTRDPPDRPIAASTASSYSRCAELESKPLRFRKR